jgi:MoxR-like ATPase
MPEGTSIRPEQYYRGSPEAPGRDTPLEFFDSYVPDPVSDAESYIADAPLRDAVNAALILSQPLLITGEPGTGKTQLAYSVGRELGYRVLPFNTKSTNVGRDLLYKYEALRHFQDAHLGLPPKPVKEYISYGKLGMAILYTQPKEKYADWVPESFVHPGPRRSIVLIDEIDKAPRDFPNDLLNELERMYFEVPELGRSNEGIEANRKLRPLVFITSNSEKSLPDPFLRRCLYYHIPFPSRDRLVEIVLSHDPFRDAGTPAWLEGAMDFFIRVRGLGGEFEKRPATAELLNWINHLNLVAGLGGAERFGARPEVIPPSLIALCKSEADMELCGSALKTWLSENAR